MTKSEAELLYPPDTKIRYSPYPNADTEIFTVKSSVQQLSTGKLYINVKEKARGIEIDNISLL